MFFCGQISCSGDWKILNFTSPEQAEEKLKYYEREQLFFFPLVIFLLGWLA